MSYQGVLRATKFVHQILRNKIEEGNTVIDGTMGNGYDTLFLVQTVGEKGRVYAFDIQKTSLENTTKRLVENNVLLNENVKLIHDGHENLEKYVNEPIHAAMFNLGYLPGGDHSIITNPETTIKALSSVLKLLVRGGIVSVVVYYGHSGGAEERDKVLNYLHSLEYNNYTVMQCSYMNQSNCPPIILLIEKR